MPNSQNSWTSQFPMEAIKKLSREIEQSENQGWGQKVEELTSTTDKTAYVGPVPRYEEARQNPELWVACRHGLIQS